MEQRYLTQNLKKLSALTACILCTTATLLHSPVSHAEVNLPDQLKSSEQFKREKLGKACPDYLKTEWKVIYSPTNGLPYRNVNDNPVLGTRTFGDLGVNKVLSHTFKTEALKKDCYLPAKGSAYLGVKVSQRQGSANQLAGDMIENDIFGTFGAGAVYDNIRLGNASRFKNFHYPNSRLALKGDWFYSRVSNLNVGGNGMFSYAIGDDMIIKQTKLYAEACCINKPLDPSRNPNKTDQARLIKTFEEMEKSDGEKQNRIPNAVFTLPLEPLKILPLKLKPLEISPK